MKSIERIVDHLIVVASASQVAGISDLLEAAGFKLRDDVVEANLGIRSRLFPISGGGFIEVACELSPGSFPHGDVFKTGPKLISVSYTTDDAAADLARWRELPGEDRAMTQAGSWRRQDGTFGYFVAVSPTPLNRDVFFALQERRLFPLPYLDSADSAPVVRHVKVTGRDAERWRQRHAQLFALPEKSGVLRAGATELSFEPTEATGTEITVTLAVPHPNVSVPLLAGRLEFVPL